MKPLSLVVLAILAASLSAQSLEVVPSRVMSDETAVIRAKGLQPGERVTIRAELTDGGGSRWASQADFAADPQGNVDTSQQAPVSGSYKQVSSMGLVWAMMPADKKVSSYAAIRDFGLQTVEFHLLSQGKDISQAHLEQVALAEGVKRIPVHEGPLRGTLFVPPGPERNPAVLVVGGSNGGQPLRPAAWLASHGYTAFALAYFRFEDLPPQLESIPLEYFQRALEWMAQRPEIGDARVGVLGTSRGGELVLQLGSMFPRISAVVAYVPANVRWASCCRNDGGPAWTWQGQALAYLLPRDPRTPAATARAAIQVENTKGPILTISGEDDHLWHSWEMADDVISRLKSHHFPYSAENLKYPHAGHLAGRQEIVPAWHGAIRNPTSGKENDLGGSAAGDAWSTIDSVPKVLAFLKANLPGIQ